MELAEGLEHESEEQLREQGVRGNGRRIREKGIFL